MITEDIFYISYEDLVPGMTEDEYLSSMEEDSPYKEKLDILFDRFFNISDTTIKRIAKTILPDIKVLDVSLDLDGVEVPLPSISITYKSESKLDEEAFIKQILKRIIR